jgi:hypothetical protein
VPSPVTLSQAMLAQVQSGAVPPTSDVVLEQLGYTPVQIARIKADREQAASEINLAAIADALSSGTLAKELGADAGLAAPQQAEKTAAANAAGAGGQQQPAGR